MPQSVSGSTLYLGMMLRIPALATFLCLPATALLTLPVSMRSLDRALVMLETASSTVLDSPCSDGPHVTKDACLTKAAGNCMWLEMSDHNACLPCEWEGINLPCVPHGAVFAGKTVNQCEMQCAHQQIITKVSPCVDVGGGVTLDECFAKGQSAFTSCMHTSYSTKEGGSKSICGPCMIAGVGKIPPYSPGNIGPEAGSTIATSASQCDMSLTDDGVPCDPVLGIPAVTQCQPLPLPPGPTAGALPLQDFGVKIDKDAPTYYASIVVPPFGPKQYEAASAAAMRAAGWPYGSSVLPSSPVVVYGPPPLEGPTLPPSMRALYGPAPPGIANIPLPGFGVGTMPPLQDAFISLNRRKTHRSRLVLARKK